MHRSRGIIAAASMLALFGIASAHSQNSNRLMFDPSGLQGSEGRTGTFQSSTTGQGGTLQRPAAAPTAQTLTPPAKPTTAKPEAKATVAKPAPARRPAAQTDTARTTGETRTATERPIPREQTPLGRLTLPTGSLGYESQTQMKTYDMSDGRRVPGYDNIQRNDSSYFGLSLRVPTANQPGSSYRGHGFE